MTGQRPKVACRHRGCPELVRPPRRFCEEHENTSPLAPQPWAKNLGKSASSRGYGARWRKLRAAFLRSHPLCAECTRRGRINAATTVDHVKPKHLGGGDEWSNLQALCDEHHKRKTGREGAQARKGKHGS
jgi:5-methylcytosine-specific restriction protein A